MANLEVLEELAPGAMSQEQVQEADFRLGVRFYMHPLLDSLLTEGGEVPADHEAVDRAKALGLKVKPHRKLDDIVIISGAGRPIYTNKEFVRITIPGDRDRIVERPVEPSDLRRFAKAYKHWQEHREKEDKGLLGTPLSEVPFVDPALREELAYFKVYTVEELVEMSDKHAAKFPNFNELRAKAQKYLDNAKGVAQAEAEAKLARENEKLQQALAELQSKVAALEPKDAEEPAEVKEPKKSKK